MLSVYSIVVFACVNSSWPTLSSGSDSESSNDFGVKQRIKPAPRRRGLPTSSRPGGHSRKKTSSGSAGDDSRALSDDEADRNKHSRRTAAKVRYVYMATYY